MPNISAAFVEYAKGQMGYYPIDADDAPVFVDLERKPGPLKAGDQIIVQVTKEAVGNKEPVLSSKISFAGKYVVFDLSKRGIFFSNKIKWPEFKEAIQTRYEALGYKDFGFIIRTNAMHADIDSIFEEIDSIHSKLEKLDKSAKLGWLTGERIRLNRLVSLFTQYITLRGGFANDGERDYASRLLEMINLVNNEGSKVANDFANDAYKELIKRMIR